MLTWRVFAEPVTYYVVLKFWKFSQILFSNSTYTKYLVLFYVVLSDISVNIVIEIYLLNQFSYIVKQYLNTGISIYWYVHIITTLSTLLLQLLVELATKRLHYQL